jgi:hypothetical protein
LGAPGAEAPPAAFFAAFSLLRRWLTVTNNSRSKIAASRAAMKMPVLSLM